MKIHTSFILGPQYSLRVWLWLIVAFGARWFGIRIGCPLSNNPFHKGILSESKPPGPKPTKKALAECLSMNYTNSPHPFPKRISWKTWEMSAFDRHPGWICVIFFVRCLAPPGKNLAWVLDVHLWVNTRTKKHPDCQKKNVFF